MENNNNNGSSSNNVNNKFITCLRWSIFALIIIIFVGAGVRAISKAFYTRHIVIHVTDKGIKRSGGSDKYMVYGKTIDGLTKVYEITDSFLAQRFDSDDRYANIVVGETYEFIVGGNRLQIFNWYPNIYSIFDVMVPDDIVWEIPPHHYNLKPAPIDETEMDDEYVSEYKPTKNNETEQEIEINETLM